MSGVGRHPLMRSRQNFPLLLQGEGSDKTKRERECRGKNQKDKWARRARQKKIV
ncbi:unnamed protein product [Meloidogyne enterolobii]|uniref:Uncharacterized protein n=1 Tax=Meloidogyne enterolobii TaxID=390850 RepID=A0ACB1B2I1_MELEN